MKRKFKNQINIFILVFPLLCSVLVSGCGKHNVARPPSMPVDTIEVRPEKLEHILKVVGNIKAQDEATLYSKVTGKLIKYTVKEGQAVKKDETVALLDRNEVGFKFQEAPLKTTLDGVVGRTYLDTGADIQLNTPVALVVDMRQVRVLIQVPEQDLPDVKEDQTAHVYVDAFPKDIFEGKVIKVSPIVDLQTRTAPVEIEVPNPEYRLKPGMFARVELVTRVLVNAVMIPEKAIAYERGMPFVFVVKDSKAQRRSVETGMRKIGRVQITKGLEGGEVVVTAGHLKIRDGSEVTIAKEQAASA